MLNIIKCMIGLRYTEYMNVMSNGSLLIFLNAEKKVYMLEIDKYHFAVFHDDYYKIDNRKVFKILEKIFI